MSNRDIRLQALLERYKKNSRQSKSKAGDIYEAFLKTVEAGYWRSGDKIPTERQLASAFSVSEGTIQSALRQLVDNRIITRSRGRGSFIADFDEGDNIFMRFFPPSMIDTAGGKMFDIHIDKVQILETHSDGAWSEFLGYCPSYIRMMRYLTVDNRFTVFSDLFFDGGRFRPLLDFNPDTLAVIHVRKIIHDRFNAPFLNAERNLHLTVADAEMAEAINVEPGGHLLFLEVLNYSLRREPIAYQRFYIPPNDWKLNIWSWKYLIKPSQNHQ